jgi:hypothetical protein
VKVLPESGALIPLEEFESVCVEVPKGVSDNLESPPKVFFDNELVPEAFLSVTVTELVHTNSYYYGSVSNCYSVSESPGIHHAEVQFFEHMDTIAWTFTILEEALPTSTPEK